jgi:hypothetical protein
MTRALAAAWPRWVAILGAALATGAALAGLLDMEGPWLELILGGALAALVAMLVARPQRAADGGRNARAHGGDVSVGDYRTMEHIGVTPATLGETVRVRLRPVR